jgi:hypothetical protein
MRTALHFGVQKRDQCAAPLFGLPAMDQVLQSDPEKSDAGRER